MSSTRTGSIATLADSNILIYAIDPRDVTKQQIAQLVIEQLTTVGQLVLSVQCLTEFFRVATQRLPQRLSAHEAADQASRYAIHSAQVFSLTPGIVLSACRMAARHSISIWDALIWAVASTNGVPVILTEDAEDGRILEGVLYRNPFVPGFDLSQIQS